MKFKVSVGMLALLGFCAAVQGQTVTTVFNNGGGDSLWSNAANWSQGLPGLTHSVKTLNAYGSPARTVILDTDAGTVKDINWYSHTAEAAINIVSGGSVTTTGNILLGNGSTLNGKNAQLYVNGGNVTAGSLFRIGQGPGSDASASMTSGSITVGSQFVVGYNAKGAFDMLGGTLTVTGTRITLIEQFHVNGTPIGGIMNMSGGSVLAGGATTFVGLAPDIAQSVAADAILTMTGGSFLTGKLAINQGNSTFINAQVALLGGRMEIASDTTDGLIIKQDDTLHIEGGMLVWNGNHLSDLGALIDEGKITWANGRDMPAAYDVSWTSGNSVLYASYNDMNSGKTTVWASPLRNSPQGPVISML
jgi:hypothetical protein